VDQLDSIVFLTQPNLKYLVSTIGKIKVFSCFKISIRIIKIRQTKFDGVVRSEPFLILMPTSLKQKQAEKCHHRSIFYCSNSHKVYPVTVLVYRSISHFKSIVQFTGILLPDFPNRLL
jgi:hypothetical protein